MSGVLHDLSTKSVNGLLNIIIFWTIQIVWALFYDLVSKFIHSERHTKFYDATNFILDNCLSLEVTFASICL